MTKRSEPNEEMPHLAFLKNSLNKTCANIAQGYFYGTMKIDYTDHGLERLKERWISKREAEEAFRRGTKEDAAGGLRKSTHKNKRGTLIVIYNIKTPKEFEIITAYWE